HDWGAPSAEDVWNEIRRLSPWHGGMSYRRLEELDGLQWPCPTDDHPGSPLRLDSFNTGVQTGGYASPLRFGETIDLAPEDGASLGVVEGECVRIVSRRGE